MRLSHRVAAWGGVVGAALLAGRGGFAFAHDGVLGTSMDMRVVACDAAAAGAARDAALAEIQRLEAILSAYLPGAQLWRANAGEPVVVSPELLTVLQLYELWQDRSGGVISPATARLKALWMAGGEQPPTDAELGRAKDAAAGDAWRIDREGRLTVREPINIDALGKAFVIERAAMAARRTAGVRGGVLDIGGDLVTWGADESGGPWRVGIADPLNPAENAPPLTVVEVSDAAIATSGGYARNAVTAGQRRSHIVDPRTGETAPAGRGVTVIARDAVTANALSTALNMLAARDGLWLAERHGAAALIADDRGAERTRGFARLELPGAVRRSAAAAEADTKPAADGAWPAGYQVQVGFEMIQSGRRRERPYMALWIEDASGRHVRTIEVWGNDTKYLKDMKSWWKHGSKDPQMVRAVARASRSLGKYTLAWDGKDQAGKPVPAGKYVVWLEVASEKGGHATGSGAIECGKEPAKGTIADSRTFKGVQIGFGPRDGK